MMIGSATYGTNGPKLGIERDGQDVRIVVHFQDHYAAIKLYDELVTSARSGGLTFSLDLANEG